VRVSKRFNNLGDAAFNICVSIWLISGGEGFPRIKD
jgi:hypothetical protein